MWKVFSGNQLRQSYQGLEWSQLVTVLIRGMISFLILGNDYPGLGEFCREFWRFKKMCETEEDGGYYAIKGFLYQFDQTIIRILENGKSYTNFEHIQDIDYENYVVQIKHKETQVYYDSKIRTPIIQLLELYKDDRSKKFILYCHFKDKHLEECILTDVQDLDKILGKNATLFEPLLKKAFIKNLTIVFSADFEAQLNETLDSIMNTFDLKTKEEGIVYHTLIRSHLLSLAIQAKPNRRINLDNLKELIKVDNNLVFYLKYSEYLGREKYLAFIKKEFFMNKGININNYERLFVLDYDSSLNLTDLLDVMKKVSEKYYRTNKSPVPYMCIRLCENTRLTEIKQTLIDSDFVFHDGTCFDGDKFRIDKLIKRATVHDGIKIKLIKDVQINSLVESLCIKEYYHFFLFDYLDIETEYRKIKVQLIEAKDILKIF